MLTQKYIYSILILSIYFYISACSASLNIVSSWKNPRYEKKNIDNILCIAILKEYFNKSDCENYMDYELNASKLNGSISLAYEDLIYNTDTRFLVSVINEYKYDYLLTIKFINNISEKADYSIINYEEYFLKSLEKINKADYKEIYANSYAEVILFSIKDNKAIWAGIIKTLDNEGPITTGMALSEEIFKALKKEDLIR